MGAKFTAVSSLSAGGEGLLTMLDQLLFFGYNKIYPEIYKNSFYCYCLLLHSNAYVKHGKTV